MTKKNLIFSDQFLVLFSLVLMGIGIFRSFYLNSNVEKKFLEQDAKNTARLNSFESNLFSVAVGVVSNLAFNAISAASDAVATNDSIDVSYTYGRFQHRAMAHFAHVNQTFFVGDYLGSGRILSILPDSIITDGATYRNVQFFISDERKDEKL